MGFFSLGVDYLQWWQRESEISMHPSMLILVLHQICFPNWVCREQLMTKPQIWFVSHTFSEQDAVHHLSQHSYSALRAEAALSFGTAGPLARCHPALVWVFGALLVHQAKLGFPRAAGCSSLTASHLHESVPWREKKSASKSNCYSKIITHFQSYPPSFWFLLELI